MGTGAANPAGETEGDEFAASVHITIALVRDTPAISREEALARILDLVSALEVENVPITSCAGQVLAGDILPTLDVPPWDCAARDGYALRAVETVAASPNCPTVLRFAGELCAGSRATPRLPPGAAVRVMTGAPLPHDADCVVPFEVTADLETASASKTVEGLPMFIQLTHPVQGGWNVRRAGTYVDAKGRGLRRGILLRPPEIAILAMLGRCIVPVVRRPTVAVLATGDELIEPGGWRDANQLYHSNGYAIAAQVLHYGGIPRLLGVAPDNPDVLAQRLQQGLAADFLVTTGGTARGARDLVGLVLKQEEDVSLWDLPVRSSRPVAFRVLRESSSGRRVLHLALPGNPLSAIVAFELLGRPVLLKLQGRSDVAPPTVVATARKDLVNPDSRHLFVPVKLEPRSGKIGAWPVGSEGKDALVLLGEADGLAIISGGVSRLRAGESVAVMIPGWAA